MKVIVLVSTGTELIIFMVSGMMLRFGFRRKKNVDNRPMFSHHMKKLENWRVGCWV